MDRQTCPGARIFRQPKPESFGCPDCGSEVEIWTDEFRRPCPRCGRIVFRDAGLGCLEWCAMAEQCLGEQAYGDLMRRKRSTIRERLLAGIAEHFGADTERIDHAKAVLERAEEILRASEAALDAAQEVSALGSFVWDLRDDSLTWSRNMYRLAGITPGEFSGTLTQVKIGRASCRERV